MDEGDTSTLLILQMNKLRSGEVKQLFSEATLLGDGGTRSQTQLHVNLNFIPSTFWWAAFHLSVFLSSLVVKQRMVMVIKVLPLGDDCF